VYREGLPGAMERYESFCGFNNRLFGARLDTAAVVYIVMVCRLTSSPHSPITRDVYW